MAQIETPVLIVGGGGAGLTASMLLSKLGVESLLVSALPSTSILPKAHVLNQRAMEVLTDLGVADEIYRRGTPAENMRYTAYYAGFAGRDPMYGRQIGRLEAWGAGGLDTDWASASPCRQANLPQIRLEPILKPGRVLFGSDRPYAPTPAVSYFAGQLDACAALDPNGHTAIDRTNAASLFPQF